MKHLLIAAVLLTVTALAQTPTYGPGLVTRIGSSLPAHCSEGEDYYKAGTGNYHCTATDTWTLDTGGSGGAAWGTITGTLTDQTDLNTALSGKLVKASNLSDLANAGTARTNLGLGDSATKDVGTGAGNVASGNHTHTGVYEPANSNIQSHISSTSNPHSVTLDQVAPAQTSNSGKTLITNGTTAAWAFFDYTNLLNKPTIPTVTGGTCTNQVVTVISTSAVPTCTTITSAYVNTSIAQTGVDINTSHQVTATHLAAALPLNQGGTGQTTQTSAFDALAPTTANGDLIYYNGTDNVALTGNTTTTRKFLRQVGNGSASAAPAWDTLTSSDIPNNAANTSGTAAALAADPSDCTTNQYATAIAANGNLTCAQPSFSQISGQIDLSSSTQVTKTVWNSANTTSTASSTNNTGEQNLQAISIPAGQLNVAGKTLHVYGSSRHTTGSTGAGTLTYKVKLCTVSGCGSGTVVTLTTWTTGTNAASSTNAPDNFEMFAAVVATGATGTLEAHGWLDSVLVNSTTTPPTRYYDANTAVSSTIDLTAALFLQCTVTASVNGTGNATDVATQRLTFAEIR